MEHAELFLGLGSESKPFAAVHGRLSSEQRTLLVVVESLARWAEAAYGEKVFDDAACGYARYCIGVAQAQKLYERAGKYP